MTEDRKNELAKRLAAHGLAVMRVDDRDTLLATVANVMKENRELLSRRDALAEQVRLLTLRAGRAENALAAIKTFGAEDYAVRHILQQAGVTL
ncbi:hypothetical protein [Geobacter sp.]|uniref:hypothetical protein n=1 Tax=Geobacter sp. TaxID=46610 RepID=UPI00262A1332|nr:hypothetical protein [Geobacter sp.]